MRILLQVRVFFVPPLGINILAIPRAHILLWSRCSLLETAQTSVDGWVSYKSNPWDGVEHGGRISTVSMSTCLKGLQVSNDCAMPCSFGSEPRHTGSPVTSLYLSILAVQKYDTSYLARSFWILFRPHSSSRCSCFATCRSLSASLCKDGRKLDESNVHCFMDESRLVLVSRAPMQ